MAGIEAVCSEMPRHLLRIELIAGHRQRMRSRRHSVLALWFHLPSNGSLVVILNRLPNRRNHEHRWLFPVAVSLQ
jgi:hypothetical protein